LLEKEIHNIGIAFEILDPNANVPVGWSHVTGHLVFDVKMDFTRKARWVLNGHRAADPDCSTYAGVVSRESVHITLTYAALNSIDILAVDIRNAYLQAPSSQKDYITCGPKHTHHFQHDCPCHSQLLVLQCPIQRLGPSSSRPGAPSFFASSSTRLIT